MTVAINIASRNGEADGATDRPKVLNFRQRGDISLIRFSKSINGIRLSTYLNNSNYKLLPFFTVIFHNLI